MCVDNVRAPAALSLKGVLGDVDDMKKKKRMPSLEQDDLSRGEAGTVD